MILGTRGSRLALAQARKVAALLESNGTPVELRVIRTAGDVQADVPLHAVKGGYGAFVRELDEHLIKGRIDAAVHSMKDIPVKRPEGLAIAAVLERESVQDVAVTRDGRALSTLPDGAIVGTSSTRRTALVCRHYPRLQPRNIRGNVDTRLKKLDGGDYDAILLAEAGLLRLGIGVPREHLDPYRFVPTANQGVIAVVARADTPALEAIGRLDHGPTRMATDAERLIVEALDGGCVTPMGIYARPEGENLDVVGEILSLDGVRQAKVRGKIRASHTREDALLLAQRLGDAGGMDLIAEAKTTLGAEIHGDE